MPHSAADLRRFRSEMKREPTPAERVLWERMIARWPKGGCYERRRQEILGFYIADFHIPRKMLIIELDGSVHADREAYDRRRDAWLRSWGFTVMRFSNAEALADPERILDLIEAVPYVVGTRKEQKSAVARARGKASWAAQKVRLRSQS